MDELNTKIVKSMTRPILKWGVPVPFLVGNLFFWACLIFFVFPWNKWPLIGLVFSHIIVVFIMIENPSFFFQIVAFVRCKFRNFRKKAYGGIYYSPINYKKSLNFSKK